MALVDSIDSVQNVVILETTLPHRCRRRRCRRQRHPRGDCRSPLLCAVRCAIAQRAPQTRNATRAPSRPLPPAVTATVAAGALASSGALGPAGMCRERCAWSCSAACRVMRRALHPWQRSSPGSCPACLFRHAMWAMSACAPRRAEGVMALCAHVSM